MSQSIGFELMFARFQLATGIIQVRWSCSVLSHALAASQKINLCCASPLCEQHFTLLLLVDRKMKINFHGTTAVISAALPLFVIVNGPRAS